VRFLFATLALSSMLPSLRADTYLVLPFFNLSKSSNLNWIGESLAETLRETLSSEGLIALDRDDCVEGYRRLAIRPYSLLTTASVVKLGETVDAEQVLFGSFDFKAADASAKNRGTLQISARVLDLKHVKQGPELKEVGALEDLAALQGQLAWELLRYLKKEGAPSEAEFRERHPAVRVDAIENYVRGLLAVNPEDEYRFFAQAARLDAHYSQPRFQLGRLMWKRKEYKAAGDWFQQVAQADVHYHEANFFLGLCRYYTGDFAAAQSTFESVARVVPLSEVYNNLGAAESRSNLPEALANFRKALEGDKSDPAYQFNVGYALWKQGDFQSAMEHFRAVLQHDPDDEQANLLLARCTSRSGSRPGDARSEGLERLKTNYEENAYLQLKALLQPHHE